jgi:hypothetical protein
MKQTYIAKLYHVTYSNEYRLIDWGYLTAEHDPRRTAWAMFSARRKITSPDRFTVRLSLATPTDLGMTEIPHAS